MLIDDLIAELGYAGNPNFVQGDGLGQAADYAHIFRRARQRMNLRGVYVLQQPATKDSYRKALVPVVYVCEAGNESSAQECRRLAWNQNAAPFLIVATRSRIRLFSSFNYEQAGNGDPSRGPSNGILDMGIALGEIASALKAFTSQSIDDGTIWREYGCFVTPEARVDWSLLDGLKKLDDVLLNDGLEWRTSHALIGKYVYLWYLRQREILSDGRLSEWGIKPEDVFDRNAKLSVFKTLLDKLDDWAVFPMEWDRTTAPRQEHLRKVASVFRGDDLNGQLHLPFDAYDFSVIPVETLSAIYEQFLHAHEPKQERPRGKELGAYYTPVPLVNFMLDELDDRLPLKEGMTCFDASCGSGAFLVQCYRRLIENRIRQDGQAIRRPAELRDLLTKHIFGLDRDGDACRVAELSLILTLLDYVRPPDLMPVHNFKLPKLHDNNIFEDDFFDPDSTWVQKMPLEQRQYDWVVGNPPWVELKPPKGDDERDAKDKKSDSDARTWIRDNNKHRPIGGAQLAEAFLWKVADNLKPDGVAAMLVPAMTLFKSESKSFRRHFFYGHDVWCLANFANLAEVLFAGRSRVPAATLFYSTLPEEARGLGQDRTILTYSPFVANQIANAPERAREQEDTWSLTVNGSEIREVRVDEASSGDSSVWKVAMWGSRLDLELLRSVSLRFEGLQKVLTRLGMRMNEGSELRDQAMSDDGVPPAVDQSLTFKRELVGAYKLDSAKLRKCGRIYSFPSDSLGRITKERAFLRKRGGEKGLEVSFPPHIVVDSARRFAVYSDEFVAIPPRQVGIAGSAEHADLLKAMSLFLVSDFAAYHQFLASPAMGIHVARADLATLKRLPFPIEGIERGGLSRWTKLHSAIIAAEATARRAKGRAAGPLFGEGERPDTIASLERELNEMVNDALGLRDSDEWLIDDLIHVRRQLIQGKIAPAASDSPSIQELRQYCEVLKRELDSFIEVATDERHMIDVCHERHSAMIAIHRGPARPLQESIRIIAADEKDARTLRDIRKKLLRKHSQWLYFERALRRYRYDNGSSYLFKPMQRLHWLRSQALVDAAEIIADRAGGEGR
jgi:hypothetical protein